MKLGLYIFFITYILIRVGLTIIYKKVEKKHSILFYENDKQLNEWRKDYFEENNQLKFEPLPEELPITMLVRAEAKKCTRIYHIDANVKRIGSVVIGLLSIFLVLYDYQISDHALDLFIAMIPGVVGLFNSAFGWIEISYPIGFQEIFPKRYQ